MLMLLSSLGLTSQQITSDPEVLTTGGELTGHPEINGDVIFQDFVGSSERSAEALHPRDDGLEVRFQNYYSKLFLPHLIFVYSYLYCSHFRALDRSDCLKCQTCF